MLMVTAVYWDLAKIFDRIPKSRGKGNFQIYLDKFVIFGKGTPYQVICSETLRRYIRHGKHVNIKQFKDAYYRLTNTPYKEGCFIATELKDELSEGTLERLYSFRSNTLYSNRFGHFLVNRYYQISPTLCRVLKKTPGFIRRKIAKGLDLFSIFATRSESQFEST